jgi:hypothetical protein
MDDHELLHDLLQRRGLTWVLEDLFKHPEIYPPGCVYNSIRKLSEGWYNHVKRKLSQL